MNGYNIDIDCLQYRQLPFKNIQEMTGIKSNQAKVLLHFGQNDLCFLKLIS